jgi:AraC-like DNA-binding protein
MKEAKNIPVYQIDHLLEKVGTPQEVFFTDTRSSFAQFSLEVPYRSNYFGVGLCTQGNAGLKANLEFYQVTKNSIIAMSPPIIKQWTEMSDDYQTMTLFFTKTLLIQTSANPNHLENFVFFEANAQHVWQLTDAEAETITTIFKNIQSKLNSVHPYKKEIIIQQINILLFELLAIYHTQTFPIFYNETRSGQLAAEFKKLIHQHFEKERSVKFYADLLFISPKHLMETIKQETGKTAGEWIDEMVILEAKILLGNPALQISQIADQLHFADPSTFGKYFKNITGVSPLAYRKSL